MHCFAIARKYDSATPSGISRVDPDILVQSDVPFIAGRAMS